jgi:hypothetical protein
VLLPRQKQKLVASTHPRHDLAFRRGNALYLFSAPKAQHCHLKPGAAPQDFVASQKAPALKARFIAGLFIFIIGAELISTRGLRGRNQEMFGIRE